MIGRTVLDNKTKFGYNRSMTSKELLRRFKNVRIWKSNGNRAPHKPLLILLALRYLINENQEKISYATIENELSNLLKKYGTSSSSINPHQPFWRLKNEKDSIWRVFNEESVTETASGDAKITDLKKGDIHAGFKNDILDLLSNDNSNYKSLAKFILEEHFPDKIHNEILNDIGLELRFYNKDFKRKRDSKFRDKVLNSYNFKCSVCGFDLKFENRPLALEAAHIQWHTHGGPNIVSNGLALCSQHHIFFDIGAISITHDYELILSDRIHGSKGHLNRLFSENKGEISLPTHFEDRPQKDFLDWHSREVFKKS